MKINELLHEGEDDAYTFQNPFPVLDYDDSAHIFDELDRIEYENYNQYIEKHNIDGNLELRNKIRDEYFNKIGHIESVPFDKIDTIEPYLDPAQLNRLVDDPENTKSSSEMPTFLKYNNRYLVSDGTHRVVAAFIRGEKSVKGLVIDINL